MKKLPDFSSWVLFTSIVVDRVTLELGVVTFFGDSSVLLRVVLSVSLETGTVVYSVLVIMVVVSLSTAKTTQTPALYQIKVRYSREEHSYYNLQIITCVLELHLQ